MGLFTINLPQSVYMVNPKADNAGGSFLFGIFTAILGLPCFGFVAGGLLAGAATLPSAAIMAVFVGIGVGMGTPYLILAAYPKLIEKIPRTGPASELVKQVMGLLLFAAAAFFLAAAFRTLLSQKPYLSESIGWWCVAFFIALTAMWLTIRSLQVTKTAWPKLVMPLISIAGLAASVLFAQSVTRDAKREYDIRQAAIAAAGGSGGAATIIPGIWNDFTPERVEAARAAGKIVVLDFTAHWCIVCKGLKKKYLEAEPLRSRLRQDDVVLIEVDLSDETAPGWAYLNSLGQTGVPTLAFFGPAVGQDDKPQILNAYTTATVQAAIERVSVAGGQQAVRP
jgi:thiol:disulfide interchange protein DsbD